MTEERKRSDSPDSKAPDSGAERQQPKTKLPDKRAKLGDTVEGEGSPGLSIGGGGGHA